MLQPISINLPSLGLLYPENHPFHDKQTIEIKPMSIAEADIMANSQYLKRKMVFEQLIKSICFKYPTLKPETVLSNESMYIILMSRIYGYNDKYVFDRICRSCGKPDKIEISLSLLNVITFDKETDIPKIPYTNEFDYVCPETNTIFKYKYLTNLDERLLLETTSKVSDRTYSARILQHIISLDGEDDKSKIAMELANMPGRIVSNFEKHLESTTPGLNLNCKDYSCRLCNAVSDFQIPLDIEFFRPTA